jgi:hypothetical protein
MPFSSSAFEDRYFPGLEIAGQPLDMKPLDPSDDVALSTTRYAQGNESESATLRRPFSFFHAQSAPILLRHRSQRAALAPHPRAVRMAY